MRESTQAKSLRILSAMLQGRKITPAEANRIGDTTDGTRFIRFIREKYPVKSFARMRLPFPSCLGKWAKTPYYETLFKAGERDMFKYFMNGTYRRRLENYKDSIRVARRHGYEFKDVQMWLDYVDELRELGMDDRSPRYICPKDLRAAHAVTSERIRRKRTAEKEAKEKAEISQREEA